MSPIASRLKEFIDRKGIDPQTLARQLGYDKPEKINRLFREGEANPSADILADLTNKFADLDLNWLLTGQKRELPNPVVATAPLTDFASQSMAALVNISAGNKTVADSNKVLSETNARLADEVIRSRNATAPDQQITEGMAGILKNVQELVVALALGKKFESEDQVYDLLYKASASKPLKVYE